MVSRRKLITFEPSLAVRNRLFVDTLCLSLSCNVAWHSSRMCTTVKIWAWEHLLQVSSMLGFVKRYWCVRRVCCIRSLARTIWSCRGSLSYVLSRVSPFLFPTRLKGFEKRFSILQYSKCFDRIFFNGAQICFYKIFIKQICFEWQSRTFYISNWATAFSPNIDRHFYDYFKILYY